MSVGAFCVLVRSKSERCIQKSTDKSRVVSIFRHMMCRIEFLAPKNKNHNNQPLIRVGKPIGRVAAWRSWPSSLGIAAKLGPLLSLAFLRVRRRGWLKMSDSPIGKVGNRRELFDFLSVVVYIRRVSLAKDIVLI